MIVRLLLVALALMFFTTGSANAQRRYLRGESTPASATSARFSALWLPDATVTVLVALETDRPGGIAAFRAIYEIDCATNAPRSVAFEAFDAEGASLGPITSVPEDLAASFERRSWERPCRRDDPPLGVAIDPPPAPAVWFDNRRFPPGFVETIAEAITFTRDREATYAAARQLLPTGHWRRQDGLPTPGVTYVGRGPVEGGRRRIDLVFVPNGPTDDPPPQAPYAYERISYSVACRSAQARVIYRLRASADHELVAYQGESPEAPFARLLHSDALTNACAGERGAEFSSLNDVLEDAQSRQRQSAP